MRTRGEAAKTSSPTRARSISPSAPRTLSPRRSTIARFTSWSSRRSRCTISSLEITAAPCRAKARSASDLPAPIPPVTATATGLVLALVVVGRSRRRALGIARAGGLRRHVVGLDPRVRLLDGSLVRARLREDLLGQPEGGCGLADRTADRLAVLHPLEGEREPAALRVHLDDLRLDGLSLRDDLPRVLDVVIGQLGDVHEALDPGQDLDEGAERHDLRHAALDDVPLVVGVDDLLPRIGLGLLEPERDALALAVDVQDLDPHLLSDLEQLGGVVDVAPRKLGNVDEPVDALEVDEGAEVDDVRDRPLDDVAGREAIENRLPHLLALLLEDRTAREDDVVPAAVELDHLAAQRLAHELVEVLDAADVHERSGQEAAHAEVEDETALDDLDHDALDGLAALGCALDPLPRHLEARALLGEDEPSLGVLLCHHERIDLVAQLHLVGRVDRAAYGELGDRDDAFGLVADVDEDLVLVDADDLAAHDLALVDDGEGRVVVGDQLAVRTPGPDAVICLLNFCFCRGLVRSHAGSRIIARDL